MEGTREHFQVAFLALRSYGRPGSQKSHLLFHQRVWANGPIAGFIFEVLEEGRDLLQQVFLGKECRSSVKDPGPPVWAGSLCKNEWVLAGRERSGCAQGQHVSLGFRWLNWCSFSSNPVSPNLCHPHIPVSDCNTRSPFLILL